MFVSLSTLTPIEQTTSLMDQRAAALGSTIAFSFEQENVSPLYLRIIQLGPSDHRFCLRLAPLGLVTTKA
jgi:hypothetical protein